MKKICNLLILGLFLTAASGAWAAVELRYSPLEGTLAPGETARVSIMVDEPLDMRTIEVFVDFDPAVVVTLGGGAGTLYTDSGFFLFKGFEEIAPGSWHGYCVVLGAEDYITGPGELFYWNVGTGAEGVSPVVTTSLVLTASNGVAFADVTLPATTLAVVDPASPVGDLPGARSSLEIFPNPFNPRTEVRFELATAGPARLEVFDTRGARVAVLHDGPLSAGPAGFSWDGRNTDGRLQSAGAYFFRLDLGGVVQVAKGTLLK